MRIIGFYRELAILILRAVMIFLLAGAGWLIYQRLPANDSEVMSSHDRTTLQLVLREALENNALGLDVEVKLYPIDIVAVQHEFFSEPRAGKRFYDFFQDRMKGRSPVTTRLDKQGRGSVSLPPGNWWLLAKLSGDEELEWRLPVSVVGAKQTVELSVQNAYTRSKSF